MSSRLFLAGVLVLAAALRLLPAPGRIAHGHVVFEYFDGNAHHKHVAHLVRHYPEPLRIDPDAGNAPSPWHPLFELLVASPIVALAGRDAEPFVIEIGAALFCPLLGLLTVVAAYGLARALGGAVAGGAAALAMALHPAHVRLTSFGYLDHHAMTPLLLVVALWVTWRGTSPRPAPKARGGKDAPILLGLVLAAMLLGDRSSLVAILLLLAGAAALPPSIMAPALAVAAAAILAATWVFPPLSRMAIGPADGALLAVAGAGLWAFGRAASPRSRLAVAGVTGLTGLLVAGPQILDVAAFTLHDPVGTSITELGSPFMTLAEARRNAVEATASILLLPLLARTSLGASAGTLSGGLLLLGLVQQRYLWNLPGLTAVAFGLAAGKLYARRSLWVCLLLVAIHVPSWLGPARGAAGGLRMAISGKEGEPWEAYEAATWLREHRRGGVVLAFWHFGHLMNVVGEKPVFLDSRVELWGGAGGRIEAHARFFLETDPARARDILRKERVRFVLTSPWHVLHMARYLRIPEERYLRDGAPTAEMERTLHDRLHVRADADLARDLGLREIWRSPLVVEDEGRRKVPFIRIWEDGKAPETAVRISVHRR